MIKFLLFVCLSAFWITGNSQNAYYDVLQLTEWYRLPDTSIKKINDAEAMLVKLLKYTGGPTAKLNNDTNWNIKAIYVQANNIYSFQQRAEIPREIILNTMKERRSRPTGFNVLVDEAKSDSNKLEV